MSYPILYAPTETDFDNNGIGILSGAVSCIVTEEANGEFELEMQYPINGIHYAEIVDRCIIKAKPNQDAKPQLFRVFSISKPMSGIVSVSAQHISYDLSGIPVSMFSASSAAEALTGLSMHAVIDCPFTFRTDKSTAAKFSVVVPGSIRSKLGGSAGSILDVYGGEFEFDNYDVILHSNRGRNRGVSIRYGKNLTGLKQNRNCSSVATGIYPYWVDFETGDVTELPEKIVNAEGTYSFEKILTVDASADFMEKPAEAQLKEYAKKYIKSNDIGIPKVSMAVSFVQLEQSEEYKGMALLEKVSLFDTVNVEFAALGVSATAKAVKVVYNTLLDRVENITLGSVRAKITDTIADQQQQIINYSKEKPSVSLVQKISASLAKEIMGASGGAVRLIDTNGDGEPDELYIADDPDPTQAVKVWRFNYNGWAASKSGYSGPFEFGATLEHGLLANFVTAAQLVAGTIKSQDGKTFFLDLDNGILNMNATRLNISGQSVDQIAQDKADAASTESKAYTDALDESLDQVEVFNRLTKDGTLPGLYMEDGQLYINANYLATGVISSKNGKIKIDLVGSSEPKFNTGVSTNGLTVRADDANVDRAFWIRTRPTESGYWISELRMRSGNGNEVFNITETSKNDGVVSDFISNDETTLTRISASTTNAGFSIYRKKSGNVFAPKGYLDYDVSEDKAKLQTDYINGKIISWKDNGDGTYTLIGR